MRICMVGTGYVGLVSGACMADFGHRVTCVDINQERIEGLVKGVIPFYEPGLDRLVLKNVDEQRLTFTTSLAEGIKDADVVFIAVQTPMSESGEADLKYVMKVGEEIGELLDRYMVIVTKSTVPVGTNRALEKIIRAKLTTDVEFDMASNPEFLREGSSIEDFMRPDRVVIGVDSERSEELMREIYRPLYLSDTPMVKTGIETAELVKYASNSFLAVKISFINEIAKLAEAVGADVFDVAKAMGLDKRIGRKFLHPGLGFGGSCLPKDTNAIVHIAAEAGSEMSIVRAAIEVNRNIPGRAIAKAENLVGDLTGKTIALLGLAFKPNTDDIRSAASIELVKLLEAKGCKLRVHDPAAMENFKLFHPDLTYCQSPYEACESADLAILVTEWNQYRQLDFNWLAEAMTGNAFLDCRNVYDRPHLEKFGFKYDCFGRADHSWPVE
ncbi:MAG: UDP-glucose/GDP-mannose dehydrogenase family protein [Candidatus Krumholzibacteria bacterium]|nr:UDP-glucose/GDP-mannose dehydrogenase family protein [Candidatus Krumholzibacteria bacterium]